MDITQLGVKVDLVGADKAGQQLDKLANTADNAEKKIKGVGDAATTAADKISKAAAQEELARQRVARAKRAEEQANLAAEKTATQREKTAKEIAARERADATATINRERAQVKAAETKARLDADSLKRQEALASKAQAFAALEQKYMSQSMAFAERSSAYKLNQSSLVENRALKTQASILQGESRLALQQEKFEFQKAQAAERAARRVGGAWASVKDMLSTFSTIVVGGFGIDAIVGKATEIVKVADNMTLLDSRLKLATKSQEDFVKTQTALRESSLKTGLNLEAQIDGFTQLERSTRAMKLSSEQLTFLTESFGKAAVVSGASAESYKSALTQLNQGFASGVIRGQEFNSVAEQAPAVMEALAAGMRGTNKEFDDLEKKGFLGVAALRKMAGEGKLVNSTTIPALIEGLKQTNKQFEEMPLTVQRASEQISTAYKVWISDQNTAVAGTSTLASGLSSIAKNFGEVVDSVVTAGAVIGTVIAGRLVNSIVTATAATKAWATITGAASKANLEAAASAAFEAANVARETEQELKNVLAKQNAFRATGELAAAQAAHANATNISVAALAKYDAALAATSMASRGAAVATGIFKSALAAIGGIPGLIVIGVMTIISYWDEIRIAMGDTRLEAEKAGDAIEKAILKGDRAAAASIINEKRLRAQAASANASAAAKELAAEERRLGLLNLGTTQGQYTPGYADYKQKEGIRKAQERGLKPVDKTALIKARNALQAANKELSDANTMLAQLENKRKDVSDKQATALAAPFYGAAPTAITGGPQSDDKKTKFKTTEESIGIEKTLEILKDKLQLQNAEAEHERKLLGYSKEATLNEINILEKKELELETNKKLSQISEILNNKNTKFAAGVKESLQEQYSSLESNRKKSEEQLKTNQANRMVGNDIAKIDTERGVALKALTKSSKEKYNLEIAFLGQLDEELTYLEAIGSMKVSEAALERKALGMQKERASFEREVSVLRANLLTAEEKLAAIRSRGSSVSKELVDAAQEQVDSAKELVQSREKEYSIVVRTYEMEKKTANLRSDMLAGIAKAFADYEDGADNLYAKGEEIAKGVINNLETIFTDFVSTGKLKFDDLFDYLKQEFKKIAVQEIFIKPITQQAQGLFSGNAAGGASSGGFNISSLFSAETGNTVGGWIGMPTLGTDVGNYFSSMFGTGTSSAASMGSGLSTGGADLVTGESVGVYAEGGAASAGTSSATSAASTAATYAGYAMAAYNGIKAVEEGQWGRAVGTALGAYFGGPIGAAIGGEIGGFVDTTFSGGGGPKSGGNYNAAFVNGVATNENFFGGYTPAQADSQLKDTATGFYTGYKSMVEDLGGVLKDFTVNLGYDTDPSGSAGNRISAQLAMGNVSTSERDLWSKSIYSIVSQSVGDVSEALADATNRMLLSALQASELPEEYASIFEGVDLKAASKEQIDVMFRAIEVIKQVNEAMEDFSNVFPQLSNLSWEAKENILLLSGGLQNFSSNLSTYYQNFYSEAEQAAFKMKDLEDKFKDLNVAMPSTKEAFRALVESQDLSTEAGRKLYTSLLSLSGAFVSVSESAKQALGSNLNGLFSDLQNAVNAEKEALRKALDARINAIEKERDAKLKALNVQLDVEKALYTKLQNAVGLISSALDTVKSQAGVSLAERTGSIASLYGMLNGVNAGANVSDFTELEKVLGIVSEPSEQLYSSFEDYTLDQARANAVLVSLNEKGGFQLSKAERQVLATEKLISITQEESEELIKLLQAEYDLAVSQWETTLKYYEDSIKSALDMTAAILSIPDAISALEAALSKVVSPPPISGSVSAPVYTGAGAAPSGTSSPVQAVNELYQQILGREADPSGLITYGAMLMQGSTVAQISDILRSSDEYKSIHGSHADGLAYVPFDGYRAELHRGERVLTASENQAFATQQASTQSLLRELIDICRQTTLNTLISAKKLEKFDGEGLPETRVV